MTDVQIFWSLCAECVEFLSQMRSGAVLMESRHGTGQTDSKEICLVVFVLSCNTLVDGPLYPMTCIFFYLPLPPPSLSFSDTCSHCCFFVFTRNKRRRQSVPLSAYSRRADVRPFDARARMRVCVCVRARELRRVPGCGCVYVCARAHEWRRVQECVCVYLCLCASLCAFVCVCVYVCRCRCQCLHLYTRVRIRAHAGTNNVLTSCHI